MYRRRRRRSAFARRGPDRRWALYGVCGFIVIALFVFFIRQADTHPPATHEVRVDLPNAFKD